MKSSRSIFEPLTQEETAVLHSLAHAPTDSMDADPQVLGTLLERGYLLKTKTGLLVTPEGLAALLDTR